MKNVAIFASGEGTNAENLFNYFNNDKRIKIKLVVTNSDTAGVIEKAERYKKMFRLSAKRPFTSIHPKLSSFWKQKK